MNERDVLWRFPTKHEREKFQRGTAQRRGFVIALRWGCRVIEIATWPFWFGWIYFSNEWQDIKRRAAENKRERELASLPRLTVEEVGTDWFWEYEMAEHRCEHPTRRGERCKRSATCKARWRAGFAITTGWLCQQHFTTLGRSGGFPSVIELAAGSELDVSDVGGAE